jgi:class 3 adenylate cyclase/tetratricopeptide (TPR) repeat protein
LQEAVRPSAEERKVVTVLFCDLVGFTAASDQADPEDVRAKLRPYHSMLRKEIERFGGTVEKFIGDAAMAVWGAPVIHEDDAERSVRAALRILQAIAELNEAHPGLELQVRIGINTGEAVVALGARPEQGEGFVTGDVVNTASRLQTVAPTGGIVVGDITYRTTSDAFEYDELAPVPVKGKEERVPIWRVKAARGRLTAELERPATPFVGRDDDLAWLQQSYRRSLKDSSIQLVTVTGEPGVGKSRLIAELHRFVGEQHHPVSWRQGRCLPYGEGITFWALGEVVKAQAGILESDSQVEARRKLEAAVRAVLEDDSEQEWLLERLALLVGANGSSSPSADRLELFTAWRRFLEAVASRTPLVLVLEDLHWADDALLDFIDHLVDYSSGVAILMICTARPELYERNPMWAGGKRNATTIALSPLTDEDTSRLVGALLSQAVLPVETQLELLERAGGNPLYAEEFVRMLSDRGLLERRGQGVTVGIREGAALPESIRALIAARLDTLPLDRKRLLQDASVIGKVFWSGAVAFMAELDEAEVKEGLHELARKELVRPQRTSSVKEQAEFSFWHGLVRVVAYSQIPRAARGRKHRRAAQWIERLAGERVADHAEILAHHLTEALDLLAASGATSEALELHDQAMRWLRLAGDRVLGIDARRAEAHYLKALEITPLEGPDRAELLVKTASAQHRAGKETQAEALLQEAVEAFGALGEQVRRGEALVLLFHVLRDHGQTVQARTVLTEAIEALEREPPGPELARAYVATARDLSLASRAGALVWAEKAFSMCWQLGMSNEAARVLQFVGMSRCEVGDLGGLDDLREALRMALDGDLDSPVIASAYNNLAETVSRYEGPKEGLDLRRAGIELAERRGVPWEAFHMRAASVLHLDELGQWDDALQAADHVLSWEQARDQPVLGAIVLPVKAHILTLRGRIIDAREAIQTCLPIAREVQDPQTLGFGLAVAALLEHSAGNASAATALAREYADVTRPESTTRFILQSFTEVIRVLIAAGRIEEAKMLVEEETGRAIGLRQEGSVLTGRALLTEAEGNLAAALEGYEEAAKRWTAIGLVLERGHALAGAGRCLLGLGRGAEAEPRLRTARDLFAGLQAQPLVAQTNSLLEEALRLTS